uniref:Putative secreted protein n=1 Tax=Anopheles darlingi TaxID=43151 RepID=A0A2M4DCE8_ANODA
MLRCRRLVVLLLWRLETVLAERGRGRGRLWCSRVPVVLLRCRVVGDRGRTGRTVRCAGRFRVVARILVVDARILPVLAIVLLVRTERRIVAVAQRRWRHIDVRTLGLETAVARPVLDLAQLATVVDVTVLALHLAVRVLRLDLERTVGRLVTVAVATVLVVPVDLLQYRYRRGVVSLCCDDGHYRGQ